MEFGNDSDIGELQQAIQVLRSSTITAGAEVRRSTGVALSSRSGGSGHGLPSKRSRAEIVELANMGTISAILEDRSSSVSGDEVAAVSGSNVGRSGNNA